MVTMSDSDSDCLSSRNLFTFQNDTSTTVRWKGPNEVHRSMNLNFSTSTNGFPSYAEKQRMCDMFNQRNARSRRDTSPMSMRSVSDKPPRNMHHSFYPTKYMQNSTMISGRDQPCSMTSSRAGSPTMSVRSIGSNVSVTADYIISALKNTKFNKYELRNIKEAYHKMMKGKARRKIAKRRNLKLFLKSSRRVSGGESGEQGSDSSLSSDDCQSVRTGITMHRGYGNASYAPSSGRISDDARSTRTDLTYLRKTIQDNTMFHDRSESFRRSNFSNMFSSGIHNSNSTVLSKRPSNMCMPPPPPPRALPRQKPAPTLKDRFKNSFLLPSQRFNKSVVPIPEEYGHSELPGKNLQSSCLQNNNVLASSDDDEDEGIFHQTVVENGGHSNSRRDHKRKRNNKGSSSDDSSSSNSKKVKVVGIQKDKSTKGVEINNKEHSTNQKSKETIQSDFVFAKPQFPVKVSTLNKEQKDVPSTGASKPSIKPKDTNDIAKPVEIEILSDKITETKEVVQEQPEIILNYTSDVSMRPSFLKRKLFTQTLDVTENRNLSNDSLSSSPQPNIYNEVQREKHKTRKLVTSGSYLNSDGLREESNLIDLIHKIVPPEQMNITTNTTQRSESNLRPSMNETKQDKSNKDICDIGNKTNDDSKNSTFTDDEIFARHKENFNVKKKIIEKNIKDCSVVIDTMKNIPIKASGEKIKSSKIEEFKIVPKKATRTKGTTEKKTSEMKTKNPSSYANAFWNSDTESEATDTSRLEPETKEVQKSNTKPQNVEKNGSNGQYHDKKSYSKSIEPNSIAQKTSDNTNENLKKNGVISEKDKPIPEKNRTVLKTNNGNTITKQHSVKNKNNLNKSQNKQVDTKKLMTTNISPIKSCKETNQNYLSTPKSATKLAPPKTTNNSIKKTLASKRRKSQLNTSKSVKRLERLMKCDITLDNIVDKKLRNSSLERSETIKKTMHTKKVVTPGKTAVKKHNTSVAKGKVKVTPTKAIKSTNSKTEIKSVSNDNARDTKFKMPSVRDKLRIVNSSLDSPLNNPIVRNIQTRRSKEMLQKTLAEPSLTESDGSLNMTRRVRGRPVKNGPVPLKPSQILHKTILQRTLVERTLTESDTSVNVTKKGQKSETAPAKRNPNLYQTLQRPVDQTITESDGSLNTTKRGRGRPRKDGSAPVQKVNNLQKNILQRTLVEPISKESDSSLNLSKRSRRSKKDASAPVKIVTVMKTSNKENAHPSKPVRDRKNTTICNCCQTSADVSKPQKVMKPPEPLVKSDKKENMDSTKVNSKLNTKDSNTKARQEVAVKKTFFDKSNVRGWGLGMATATIGVIPRHCGTEEPFNNTVIDDDAASVTIRSVASTSAMTRSKRPKFLRVF